MAQNPQSVDCDLQWGQVSQLLLFDLNVQQTKMECPKAKWNAVSLFLRQQSNIGRR